KVIADAMSALEAKRVQLGLPSPTSDAAPAPDACRRGDTKSVSVIIKVIADAMSALEAKRVQLGLPSPTSDAAPAPDAC
ncbi:dihydroxyacetone kinase subunit DhaM, partial [Klebsiella pneumoniae]